MISLRNDTITIRTCSGNLMTFCQPIPLGNICARFPEEECVSIDITPEDFEEIIMDYVDRKIRERDRARAKKNTQ